jgi:spermidine synthase
MSAAAPAAARAGVSSWFLLAATLVIAACGLAYELIAAALASYLIGDAVTRFSTVIGTYLFSMGVGAWLARYVRRNILATFVEIEIAVGVIGGFSAFLLFGAFAIGVLFQPLLYLLVFIVGVLVGTEIPLLMRILKSYLRFEELVSRVLSLDYLGALAVSLMFPLWFVPHLGLIRTGLLFGAINVLVAAYSLHLFRAELQRRSLWIASAGALLVLGAGAWHAEQFSRFVERHMYSGDVLISKQTAYQRIVVARRGENISLYLNGHHQFASRDEYRYHEALVHPALSALNSPRKALVLGGGDGLALRELLKYPSLQEITLVDIDAAVTDLFKSHPQLRLLNEGALDHPKVRVVNQDAWLWLADSLESFDAIVIDLPDPSGYGVAKLYTAPFYRLVLRRLREHGLIAVQATSPLFAREAYWCIVATLESAGLDATPYHALVPSFGEWGFVLAGRRPYTMPGALPPGMRFLTLETLPGLFLFNPDTERLAVEPNRLDSQILVRYYDKGWSAAARDLPRGWD